MSPPFQTAWSLLRLSAARLEFTSCESYILAEDYLKATLKIYSRENKIIAEFESGTRTNQNRLYRPQTEMKRGTRPF